MSKIFKEYLQKQISSGFWVIFSDKEQEIPLCDQASLLVARFQGSAKETEASIWASYSHDLLSEEETVGIFNQLEELYNACPDIRPRSS